MYFSCFMLLIRFFGFKLKPASFFTHTQRLGFIQLTHNTMCPEYKGNTATANHRKVYFCTREPTGLHFVVRKMLHGWSHL